MSVHPPQAVPKWTIRPTPELPIGKRQLHSGDGKARTIGRAMVENESPGIRSAVNLQQIGRLRFAGPFSRADAA